MNWKKMANGRDAGKRKDWLFFLDDIAENYIAPGGRMYLFFNDWPHGDFNEVKSRISLAATTCVWA